MPTEERFTQLRAVAVKVGGFVKLRQPASVAVAGPGVGALLPGCSPPRCALENPTR